jgi:hypothetical protein
MDLYQRHRGDVQAVVDMMMPIMDGPANFDAAVRSPGQGDWHERAGVRSDAEQGGSCLLKKPYASESVRQLAEVINNEV